MTLASIPNRRGMTLIELLIALAITAMVAAAIAAMLSAVTNGERSRRDNRGYIVRTHAAKARTLLLSRFLRDSRVSRCNRVATSVFRGEESLLEALCED